MKNVNILRANGVNIDKSLELLREQGRVKALELELQNKEIELLKLKLKERLISEGKIEEALNI